jgi:hypothetical protein
MLSVSLAAHPPESSLCPLPQLASHRVAVQLRVLSLGSPASSRAGMEIEICVSRCARCRGSIREDSKLLKSGGAAQWLCVTAMG